MRYQRTWAKQKAEIIQLVRKSPLSVTETLARLGVARSTYYSWRCREQLQGQQGLVDRAPTARRVWNRLPDGEVAKVLEYAHKHTDLSSGELACKITDEAGFSVSESSVYRILKRHGLVVPAQVEGVQAAAEFRRNTTRVHELWQTDLTYFFVHGWGWYYVGGILDDYSRYLLAYQVVADMTGATLTDLVHEAVELTGMAQVPLEHKPVLLSDNGSGYLSGPFNEYLELMQIRHLFAAALHPQTIGKFERLNRTAKAKLGLVLYTSPQELQEAVACFYHWYNHQRYHEALGNLRPVDVYQGRGQQVLSRRKEVQRRTVQARHQPNLALMPTTR